MSETVMALTEQEVELLDQCETEIRQSLDVVKKLMYPALKIVKDKKLYREFGTIENWALKQFDMTARNLNNWLLLGEVIDNLAGHGINLDDMALRHAMALNDVEPRNQADVWNSVIEKVGNQDDVTEKDIRKAINEMVEEGRVNLREKKAGNKLVRPPVERMVDLWDNMTPNQRIEAIERILELEFYEETTAAQFVAQFVTKKLGAIQPELVNAN